MQELFLGSCLLQGLNLNEIQSGWVVSAPSFAAMFAMLFSGRLSDLIGRKKTLIFVAFLSAISAILSAMATSYEMLYVARIIGGIAFGAALVLAPMHIAEISTAENRGKLVSLQQLNIVFGFFVMIKIVPETKGKSLEELE